MAKEEKKTPVYFVDIRSLDELDLIEKMITFYSVSLVLRGIKKFLLSETLIKVLAIYFKYGYNNESKQIVQELFNLDGKLSLNSYNFTLVREGYLVNNVVSKRKKELNNDLKTLKRYYESSDFSGQYPFLIRFMKDV